MEFVYAFRKVFRTSALERGLRVINQTRLDQHSLRTAQTITAKVCVSSCILLKVCTLLFNTSLFCKFINKLLFFTSARSCSIIAILKMFLNSLELQLSDV